MKTVSVIGATGGVGRHVVRLALERGYAVRALARTPSKLDLEHPHLDIVRGDAKDLEALRNAVRGAEIVLSCLGNRPRETPVVAEGTRKILAAMGDEGTSRLALITAIGTNESFRQLFRIGPPGWLFAAIFPTALRATKRDLEEAERVVRASEVPAVIVRPSGLNDRPGKGAWAASDSCGPVGGFIPREDVAAFLVSLVEDARYDGTAISIGGT